MRVETKHLLYMDRKGPPPTTLPPTITTICGTLGQHGEADDKF